MEVGHKSHPTMDAETVKKKLLLLFGGSEKFRAELFRSRWLGGFQFRRFRLWRRNLSPGRVGRRFGHRTDDENWSLSGRWVVAASSGPNVVKMSVTDFNGFQRISSDLS